MNVDQVKLEAFLGKMIGYMTGSTICCSIWLGDELGLYRELAGSGPRTANSVAAKTGCNARLVREWLDAQAAGGLVAYDPAADTYEFSPEAALALADDGSPVFVARAMNALGSMYLDMQKVAAAFRGNGALSWSEHNPCLFCGTEWFFRTGYRAYLTTQWIPALEGVETKLRAGAHVADIGCGHGASVVVMASTYPNSTFCGFDFHARFNGKPLRELPLRPSDYVRRQVRVAVFCYEGPRPLIDQLGPEMLMFSSDYPHAEGIARPIPS